MVARIIKPLIGILATGYILFYYSELVFWARAKPTDTLPGWTVTWLVYSLAAFVFLDGVARFRVRSPWALFLAGAVFGWMTEGIIVQTMYEDLPRSISFTGLAWHAMITVWVGWYLVRRALFAGVKATLLASTAIGFTYGLWAISWWVEPGEIPVHPSAFALYAVLSTLLLAFAYGIHDRFVPVFFKPNRALEIVVGILFLLYFFFITIPVALWAAAILPALLLLVYLTLRRNWQRETREPLHTSFARTDQPGRYLGLLPIPVAASITYAAAFYLGLQWYTNWVLYLITMPAGFILFIVSVVKVWMTKEPANQG